MMQVGGKALSVPAALPFLAVHPAAVPFGGMVPFEGRYRVYAPVNPEAQFGILVPFGCFIILQGFPIGQVLFLGLNKASRQDDQQDYRVSFH